MNNLEKNQIKFNPQFYNKINNITGWLVFLIASITFLSTIEPTTSFWDCGEFIASAFKLEVGHPPGAPFFMILARVFSLLTDDVTKVAMFINALSALASAFTILFLFWTITYFAKKIVTKKTKDLDLSNVVEIMASGIIGALAYTFSDTFWFSAVEGEVYALSSLFTAIVFWAIIKWERVANEKHANRWIIFIAYMMGLSIGVHLLNLLAIPAIVFVYYFKKYETTKLGIFYATLVSLAILGTIMYGIIPGIIKIASIFELIFVNKFGMPFNSGVFIYIILLSSAVIYGIYYSIKKSKVLLNTILLSFIVIMIGYSSFTMIVIRSIAKPPMNENQPDNVFALLSYLNREQYGDRPLVYGQYFNAKPTDQIEKYTYIPENGKYKKIKKTNPEYIYDYASKTIFPRMYSSQQRHIRGYKTWANIKDTNKKPSFAQNLAFFFKYQVGHMYLRYFMWNFAGRQNDTQGYGDYFNGNWLSGISFIDNIRLGNQDIITQDMKNEKARNTYYMLPFILGLIGMFFMYVKRPKQFSIVLLLYVLTGLAIVVYLNQTPGQPRERDYAYAGSFYAFAIWIGIGVLAISNLLKKYLPKMTSVAIAGTITLLLVPGILLSENWDDHDRSGRYTARDLAKNYLNSCAPNSILFTYGDNDTFPLWYVQEVEGYRTDVRVVNLSLLGTYWYIDQMKQRAYDSEPVQFSFTSKQYQQGTRDYLFVYDRINKTIDLKKVMDFVGSDDLDTKVQVNDGSFMNFVPVKSLALPVNMKNAIKNGIVAEKDTAKIVEHIIFELEKEHITKSEMMVLDMLANYKWDYPIYFATSVGTENYLGLQDYFQLEGFAYKLVPFVTQNINGDIGNVETDILYENVMNKFVWGRMNEDDVLIENYNKRVLSIMKVRDVFVRLSNELYKENKNEKAIKVLDRIVELTPHKQIPYDYFMIPVAEEYYKNGKNEKANKIVKKLVEIYKDKLTYYSRLDKKMLSAVSYEIQLYNSIVSGLIDLTESYNQKELSEEIKNIFL